MKRILQQSPLASFVLKPKAGHQVHHRILELGDSDTLVELLVHDPGDTPRALLKCREVTRGDYPCAIAQ
ncbi:unannotated protein [freshwater metagenome]|uniref:Unannotated protein n=1 Tax=freshwater metagenome TaxID=449393 RepID=A0A6J6JYC3_9ZZZZ